MKNNKYALSAIALSLSLLSQQADAAVTIYEKDKMSFSTDGLVNVFYSNSSIDKTDAAGNTSDRNQSRVRMGFLPNNIGFNFSNEVSDVKVDVRSSFWVSINDSDNSRDASPADLGTGSLIDVRQFYATVTGDWGSILIGKDFGLFNRENIMSDQLLLGFGQTSDFFGLVDGGNVSFGNISTGYTYAFPKSQITYRSKDMNGFNFAFGIIDPNKSASNSSEDTPRIEAELKYMGDMGASTKFTTWLSGVSQSSEINNVSQNQNGIGGGVKITNAGLSFTVSGYSSNGLGHVAGLDHLVGDDDIKSEGYLTQGAYTFGDNRVVLSYGQSEVKNAGASNQKHSNTSLAYFRTLYTGVTFVAEFNQTKADMTNSLVDEKNNTIALGAVVTF